MRILIASSNIGKIQIYAQICKELGLDFCSLRDIDLKIEVEEDGKTTMDNAIKKARVYNKEFKMPVICNDSGLYIEKLSPEDQPGVFVRRYGGRELSDEETIDIFSKKLEKVGGKSDSYFDVALALIDQNGVLHTRNFKSERLMLAKPSKVICKGLPLRSLDWCEKLGKYMSELTIEEANKSEGECIIDQKNFIKEVFCKG